MGLKIGNRILAVAALLLLCSPAQGGGPLYLGGPGLGTAGQALIWNPAAMPIQYRVDSGPLAQTPGGSVVIDNAAGITRVQNMFAVWQSVATANIAYTNIGPIQPTGAFAGGDVKTLADFNAVEGACSAGAHSPIVFDADGSLNAALTGDPLIIGFAGVCSVNAATGFIVTAEGLLNGRFQDGINDNNTNLEISANDFNQVFVHEFGHFSGLDHSQINVSVLQGQTRNCGADVTAGLPVMFPVLLCTARATLGLAPLAPDDMAWISNLYPVPSPPPAGKQAFSGAYGFIRGTVFFSDGITAAQGVNVIARSVSNPLSVAVSAVSGYKFTGNFGQSVSCLNANDPSCNAGGSPFGSRDTTLIGTFDIPVPPGQYTVNVESVDPSFVGASGLNPLNPPIPMPGTAPSAPTVTVTAGQTTTVNITLVGTQPRFDSFETSELWFPALAPWRREHEILIRRFPA